MPGRQIRVLHALGTLDPGGIETWLLNVLKYINRDEFQFDFCTFGSHAGVRAPEAEALGARVLRCPRNSNLWSFSRRFRQILRGGDYDVVHSHVHLFSGAILRWAQAEGVPVRIAHSHTNQDDHPESIGRRCYRALMKSWIKRHATQGLAASRSAATALFGESWERDDRLRVLYYGIDTQPFEVPVDVEGIRSELGIPQGASVVGHVGRFVPAKNHNFLLDVAGEVLRLRSDIHFLLVGDGLLRADVERRANVMSPSGKIHFAGSRTDVAVLMRSMDLLLFPSLYEGFGLVLIEAQAAGLSCLVSSAVSDETVAIANKVRFLPLSVGPARWANEVVATLNDHHRVSTLRSNGQLAARFSIRKSSQELALTYQGSCIREVDRKVCLTQFHSDRP